jgi:hypothetical protein
MKNAIWIIKFTSFGLQLIGYFVYNKVTFNFSVFIRDSNEKCYIGY